METATAQAPAQAHSAFIRARLGSLLAILPLGVWVVIHIWNNLAVFEGPDQWQASVTEYAHPVAQLLTALVALLPLVLHTVWGFGRLLTTRPNNVRYGYYANLKYALQRLSAIGVLLFVGAHLWLAALYPRLVLGHAERFADIAHEMRFDLATLPVYLLGTLGVAYHLGNGLQTFAMGWGLVSSRRGLKRLEWLSIGFFVVVLSMAWAAIFGLWRAGAHS